MMLILNKKATKNLLCIYGHAITHDHMIIISELENVDRGYCGFIFGLFAGCPEEKKEKIKMIIAF